MKKLIPVFEMLIVYFLLFYPVWSHLTMTLLTLAFLTSGLVFSLFYGIRGSVIGCFALYFAFFRYHHFRLTEFNSESVMVTLTGILLISVSGAVKSHLDRIITTLGQRNDLLEKRGHDHHARITSIDMSHKKFLEDAFFKIEHPAYLYHELRKHSNRIDNIREFSSKLFSVLNRYLSVEIGCLYRFEDNEVSKVFEFGQSRLSSKYSRTEFPDWIQLVLKKPEIRFSKFPDRHDLLIVIPICTGFEERVKYAIVIESIRYVMINANTFRNMKVISLIIRMIFENKLFRDQSKGQSISEKTLVYNQEITRKWLPERLKFYKNARIPFQVITLELAAKDKIQLDNLLIGIDVSTRIFDEKYFLVDHLVILFPFMDDIEMILRRFDAQSIPRDQVKVLDKYGIKELLLLAAR